MTGEMRGPGGVEQLDPKVMEVLVVLAERAGQVVLRQELFDRVWPGLVVTDHVLSRCIYQLRNHLSRAAGSDRDTSLLETLPKRGFRLKCEVTAADSAPERLAASSPSGSSLPEPVPAPQVRRLASNAGVVSGLLVAAIAATAWLLLARDGAWRDPLAGATYTRFTDFDGDERAAAVSGDGKLVAFLSDRGGSTNVWVSQVGTGQFRKLTERHPGEIDNPSVRNLAFSPDGAFVTLWVRRSGAGQTEPRIDVWAVDIIGGPPRPYIEGAAELDWSKDGSRFVYHPATRGDPLLVVGSSGGTGREILAGGELHNHFPVWSPDDEFIYFTRGVPPGVMDIWRIRPTGSDLERVTFHESEVTFPVFLDEHTLLYLATADDGAGSWLYGMNTARHEVHRIGSGVEHYTSLAASEDGRRVVATVATPRVSLWRVPIAEHVVDDSAATPIALPTLGGTSPRMGTDYLLYVAPKDGADVIWTLADGAATPLWSAQAGRAIGAPAIDPHGRRIAFPVTGDGRTRLFVMSTDGTGVRSLAPDLDVRGAPAWSPDGEWLAVAADDGNGPRVFRIPARGGAPIATVDEYSTSPAWSPDGVFLVYSGAESGPTFSLKAVNVSAAMPHLLPNLVLPRGARRVAFRGDQPVLVILDGDVAHKNFWLVDLVTGNRRQLTSFGPGFTIRDFDVSADGTEIVFDRVDDEADVVLIDRDG